MKKWIFPFFILNIIIIIPILNAQTYIDNIFIDPVINGWIGSSLNDYVRPGCDKIPLNTWYHGPWSGTHQQITQSFRCQQPSNVVISYTEAYGCGTNSAEHDYIRLTVNGNVLQRNSRLSILQENGWYDCPIEYQTKCNSHTFTLFDRKVLLGIFSSNEDINVVFDGDTSQNDEELIVMNIKLECSSIQTNTPTTFPTIIPTLNPSNIPTVSPTIIETSESNMSSTPNTTLVVNNHFNQSSESMQLMETTTNAPMNQTNTSNVSSTENTTLAVSNQSNKFNQSIQTTTKAPLNPTSYPTAFPTIIETIIETSNVALAFTTTKTISNTVIVKEIIDTRNFIRIRLLYVYIVSTLYILIVLWLIFGIFYYNCKRKPKQIRITLKTPKPIISSPNFGEI